MQLLGGQAVLTGKWMRAVSDQLPNWPLEPVLSHSIGMTETFVAAGGQALAPAVAQKIKEFNASLASRDSQEFEKWMEANAESDLLTWAEIQWLATCTV